MAKRRVETPFWRIFGSAIPAVARMVVVAHDLRWVSQEEGRTAVANDVEVLGMRLLRALNEEAIGDPETAVLAEDVARPPSQGRLWLLRSKPAAAACLGLLRR